MSKTSKMHSYYFNIFVLSIFSIFSSSLCDSIEKEFNREQDIDLSYILYGDEAQRYQFPYHVSLQKKIDDKFRHICSGAILEGKWIITTAYCASNSQLPLRIVAGSLVQREIHSDIQIIGVESIILHPNYTGDISENDLALLKLKRPLKYTKAVFPIKLPPEPMEDVLRVAMVIGWNVHNQSSERISFQSLFYVIVHIIPNSKCVPYLKDLNISPATVVCSEKIIKQPYCPGESGGIAVVYGGYLLGITSWGLSSCDLTVYTNVFSFKDFILRYVDLN